VLAAHLIGCGGGSDDPAPPPVLDSTARAVNLALMARPNAVVSSSPEFASALVAATRGLWYDAISLTKTVTSTYPLPLSPWHFGRDTTPTDNVYSAALASGVHGKSWQVNCGATEALKYPIRVAELDSLLAAGSLSSISAAQFLDKSASGLPRNHLSVAGIWRTVNTISVGDQVRELLSDCQLSSVSEVGQFDFVSDGLIDAKVVSIPTEDRMVVQSVVTELVTTSSSGRSTLNGTYYGQFSGTLVGGRYVWGLSELVHDDVRVSFQDLNAPLSQDDPRVRHAVLLAPAPPGASVAGHFRVVFTNWTVDLQTRTAAAGSVTVSDAAGNTATITASLNGYRVVIRKSGVSQAFDVPV